MKFSDPGFKCSHCHQDVVVNEFIGTHNRNHCPFCLYSKHVDLKVSGDRRADCGGLMKPVGLTFKHEGSYKQGEIMLIHKCTDCDRVSINRLAADDNEQQILQVFESSLNLDPELADQLSNENIKVLTEHDRQEINTQLFGKNYS